MDIFNIPFFRSYEANLGWLMRTVKKWDLKLNEFFQGGGIRDVIEGILEDHPEWTPIGMMSISADDISNLTKNVGYIKEITWTKTRYNDTDCYTTYVPLRDNEGNMIELYMADGNGLSPLQYADENYTSLTINASLGFEIGDEWENPIIIGDGAVLNNNPITNPPESYIYLGITANREIIEYDGASVSDADTFLNDGCEQVFDAFYKIVANSQAVDLAGFPSNVYDKNPRQCLGIKNDGSIIIVTCDGRTLVDKGLTIPDLQQFMINAGCLNAWNLDGGGSTSTIVDGVKINRNIDDGGTTDRKIQYTLNAKRRG